MDTGGKAKTVRRVIIAVLFVTFSGYAGIITTEPIPPYWQTTAGFGHSRVYIGQTFHTPSGPPILAGDLTVFLKSRLGVPFRLLIVDAMPGSSPVNLCFESTTANVQASLDLKPYTIALGGLLLQPDTDYAWILDYFSVGDPNNQFVSTSIGLASNPEDMGQGNYPDGYAFEFSNGAFFPEGTRQDHFESNNWFVPINKDFAFQLNYTPVPEPAPVGMIALFTGGLYFIRRFFIF
jgi:hypothetical protein